MSDRRSPHFLIALASLASLLLLAAPSQVLAGDAASVPPPISTWIDWSACAKSPTYAKVHAEAPLYDDRSLWPLLDHSEAYFKETWPKARLLVWAKPGENGEWTDAASWQEDGKPTAKIPDQDTDVLLPASEKNYVINDPAGHIDCRHITLEKGARLQGGDVHDLWVYGNCWVKIGANLGVNITVPKGGKQTFNRNDHPLGRSAIGHPTGGDGNIDGHYIHVEKDQAGSVEYLGTHHAADKMFLKSGTVIVGPDSCLMSGGWNRPVVEAPATLILMSGAYTGQRDFNDGRFCEDSLRVEGTLLAGTKERPLTRDAVISLNYKDVGAYANARGMIVGPGGQVSVNSKDPRSARLVFRWSGVDWGFDPKGKGLDSSADVPRRISMSFLGKVDLNGVLFMDVDKGGIQLADMTMKDGWKAVSYGANCGAAPQGLLGAAAKGVAKKKTQSESKAEPKPAGAGAPLYETQVWEPLRQLTWAKPGQDGDPDLAANWLEGGKPANAPPNRGCDVTVPESGKPYSVGGDATFNVSARHLTIGRNATLRCRQAILYGNTWVKEGGCFATTAGIMLKGINHCFIRDDNPPVKDADGVPAVAPKGLKLYELIVRKSYLGEPSSVESLGFIHVEDRFFFADPSANNGSACIGASQFIVGPDATLTFGQFGTDSMHRGSAMMGTLVLMGGSVFQRHHNAFQGGADLTTGGWLQVNIQAGTPERPLTKDAVLGLSAIEQDDQWSLLLRSGGHSIAVTSKDPGKARLVLRWNGHKSDLLTARGGKPRIVLGLFGDCKFDGVEFDDVGKGGIRLADPTSWKNWSNVSFGKSCDGTGDMLISQAAVPKQD